MRIAGIFGVLLAAVLAAGSAHAEPPTAGGTPERAEAASEEHESHEINWAYGFIGEKEGASPTLAYRPKGMPAPFLANVLNAVMLLTILVVVGRKPAAEGLKKRKARIVEGMEQAGEMKADAAARLAEYEHKLEHIGQEIERIRRDMREAAEAERGRILQEAKERRDRMERDAKLLVEQELTAAREALVRETVAAAVRSAEEIVAKNLGAADQDRIAQDHLETLRRTPLGAQGARS